MRCTLSDRTEAPYAAPAGFRRPSPAHRPSCLSSSTGPKESGFDVACTDHTVIPGLELKRHFAAPRKSRLITTGGWPTSKKCDRIKSTLLTDLSGGMMIFIRAEIKSGYRSFRNASLAADTPSLPSVLQRKTPYLSQALPGAGPWPESWLQMNPGGRR